MVLLVSRLAALVLLTAAAAVLVTGSGASRAAAPKRSGTIAFIRQEGSTVFGGGLFVVRPDGSGLRRLTPPETRVDAYAWSPDGRLIAYIDQQFSLWLVHPDGGGRKLLLPASQLLAGSLSWSADGKEIAISSGRLQGQVLWCDTLYLVPVDGGAPVSLKTAGCGPAWSPRGDEIAYDRGGGIFVIRPDGKGRRQIARGGGVHWSADGAQLAFGGAIHLSSGVTDRYHAFGVVDADGRDFHVVTTHAYTEYGVAWSPHGRRILYGRADRKGIYVIDSDGKNNHRLTLDSPREAAGGALAWSPDGASIVYATDRTGNENLYVIGSDGRGKVQLTNTPNDEVDPTWVPTH
jgi:Tol biopolymer transport system component